MITDNFGRTVRKRELKDSLAEDFDVYFVDGIKIKAPKGTDISVVLNTANSMAPEGWAPTPAATPEDALAKLKELLATMGITELRLTPEENP